MKFNATLNDYFREVHCICPKCKGHAIITAESKYALPWRPSNVSLVCHGCAYRETWPIPSWKSDFVNYNPGSGIEPYFGYSLFFGVTIKGKTLGILSPKHANDISEYIAYALRPSPINSKWSMVNRLPKWVISAKNRSLVLKALSKIRN
ncbi:MULTISPECIES: hypothetical protein [Vibrio]|uniref:Uncharacterized protein n=1 Tax=Vibrio bivalvicida TaxID=1276888 RepID=A0A177Y633_9VIBR|nr:MULTISPECIES: hypothetical protein [Vibrio]KLN66440.1 hypothetical protein ZX61_01920 [Vibrio sp. VPAP30]OAJ96318.1 hypothetical protein APB76_00695 [Vibrio bivalvicida]